MTSSVSRRKRVKAPVDRWPCLLRSRLDGTRVQPTPNGARSNGARSNGAWPDGAQLRHDAQRKNIPTSQQGSKLTNGQLALLQHKYDRVFYTPFRHVGQTPRRCYLFNVIVAFEWIPSFAELGLLRNVCDEFAELLFDLTDGYMTIGQVIVGGLELMGCADMQIFASNRLHPRAWVNGMHDPQKYQPIRIGRGMWNKLEHRLYPWHKKDGAAVLVHEWAHYALGLKDQYLKPVYINDLKLTLVLPERNPVANTLMANLLSNELLSTPLQAASHTEWGALSTNQEFAWLQIPSAFQPQEIPPEESPQPAFRVVGSARSIAPLLWMRWEAAGDLAEYLDNDHCWIYVLKGSLEAPQQLIAQGVFEDRPDGFPLLGAAAGDLIIAVGTRQQQSGPQREVVAYTRIPDSGQLQRGAVALGAWQDATPAAPALVAVRGDLSGERDGRPSYQITLDIGGGQGWSQHLFPLDAPTQDPDAQGGDTVFALDGHVLLTAGPSASTGWQLALTTFSIGGSPPAGFPAHPNPIPAGSADGNAMIFFHDPAGGDLDNAKYVPGATPYNGYDRYGALRVVTTTNLHAGPGAPAAPNDGPRSYTFAVTTNRSFGSQELQLAQLDPTLVLYVDTDPIEGAPATAAEAAPPRRLQICRLVGEHWVPLAESYHRPSDYLVAIPLSATTATGLYDPAPRPEYYRVFLMR